MDIAHIELVPKHNLGRWYNFSLDVYFPEGVPENALEQIGNGLVKIYEMHLPMVDTSDTKSSAV